MRLLDELGFARVNAFGEEIEEARDLFWRCLPQRLGGLDRGCQRTIAVGPRAHRVLTGQRLSRGRVYRVKTPDRLSFAPLTGDKDRLKCHSSHNYHGIAEHADFGNLDLDDVVLLQGE
jgi:hypothetical protein